MRPAPPSHPRQPARCSCSGWGRWHCSPPRCPRCWPRSPRPRCRASSQRWTRRRTAGPCPARAGYPRKQAISAAPAVLGCAEQHQSVPSLLLVSGRAPASCAPPVLAALCVALPFQSRFSAALHMTAQPLSPSALIDAQAGQARVRRVLQRRGKAGHAQVRSAEAVHE